MSSSDTEKFDPKRRRLCPDGACVGLLDESGRCKECGRTASGKVEAVSAPDAASGNVEALSVPDLDEESDVGFDVEPDQERASEPEELSAETGGFDPTRKLCPDGACVGVIGADGRCSVCGQAG